MALPKVSLPTKEVELSNGTKVTLRGLKRSECLPFINQELDEDKAQALILAAVFEVSEEAATEWMNEAPVIDVATITQAVLTLSGIKEEVPKA